MIVFAAATLAILAVARPLLLKQRARNALRRKLTEESGEDLTVRCRSVFADHGSAKAALAASLSVVYLEAFKDLDPQGMNRNLYEVSCHPVTGKARDIIDLTSRT